MTSEAPTPEAVDSFRSKLRAGDMVGAFWTIKQLRPEDAAMMMLRAGFGVAYDHKRNIKHFWTRTQADIVEACRRNTDGYGLRGKDV
ncbi:hypothetical protein [Paraburkholderia phytofirmans]|jgi:hypothetical protein|uniref:Uncharacterized protein n=1 Tax=Paraburkholderia phytofirmans (strain DSM 17436 / LMG 22146 / PsJN) TaxID=398527 RepID=B2TH67_PARPJ|nr:hypothetical protein [Paraburkholderia phytofirmans]ACD21616.1 hypothetical protein Bphyt_7331 [Paraburkholderia phytofirmans PsJN]